MSDKIETGSFKIRPAIPNDLKEIYQVEILSFREPYPLSLLTQLVRDFDSVSLVIEQENKIIGYAVGLIRGRGLTKKGMIVSIAIHPNYRNQKFGDHLLAQLISELKKRGVSTFELEVRISNIIALKMYEKFGFKIKDTKRRYYNDGEDAYLMICILEN
ncbi:MAG: ribosomal protein S18-alanine N-acetyltransferase [Candidatus Helarchaeota archaeon]|nr:ribosomal protein S18-alanine N-acetyltransferase [Candidatus Helarchaeota archaeon]